MAFRVTRKRECILLLTGCMVSWKDLVEALAKAHLRSVNAFSSNGLANCDCVAAIFMEGICIPNYLNSG